MNEMTEKLDVEGIIAGGVWYPKQYADEKAAVHRERFKQEAEQQVTKWRSEGHRFALQRSGLPPQPLKDLSEIKSLDIYQNIVGLNERVVSDLAYYFQSQLARQIELGIYEKLRNRNPA
jgi:hypothetical protein